MAISDKHIDGLEAMLAGETDAQAIVYLLTFHKIVEGKTSGDVRTLLGYETVAMFHVLRRLAPETFEDALAIWREETGDG